MNDKFLLIDPQKNTILLTPDAVSEAFHHDKLSGGDIRKHKTKKALLETLSEYLKRG